MTGLPGGMRHPLPAAAPEGPARPDQRAQIETRGPHPTSRRTAGSPAGPVAPATTPLPGTRAARPEPGTPGPGYAVAVERGGTPGNEVTSLPHSAILGGQLVDESAHARHEGLILRSSVTIGCDTPGRRVHAVRLDAAHSTEGPLQITSRCLLQSRLGASA
jgi:hypothetical protein